MPSSRAIWAFGLPLLYASWTASFLNSAVKLGCGFGMIFSFFKDCLSTFYHSTLLGEDQLWNTETGECCLILEGHSNGIRTVAFAPNGAILASGGDDQTIRLWDTGTGECRFILEGHSNGVRSVAFSPTGAVLASGGDDRSVRLWEVREGK